MSPPDPRPWSPRRIAPLAAAVGLVAFAFACQRIYDPDTWWHLATGRWVIANGRLPMDDVFSFAAPGEPWVAVQALPATAMYLVWRAGGADALVLSKALLVAASFALAFLLMVRARLHPLLAATALVLAVPIARFQFRERPQVLMFALLAVFFWLLAEDRAERRPRTWILLGIAQVVWANVHASFVLGIALAGALLLERLLALGAARLGRGGPADPGAVRAAAGLVLLLSAASLVQPYGTELVAETFRVAVRAGVTRTMAIEEYKPLAPAEYPGFMALLAATALSFAAAGRRTRPLALATFLGLAAMALASVRFAAVAALAFAFVLALNLQPLAERAASAAGGLPPRARRLAVPALAAALLAFVALSFRASFGPGREAQFGLGVNESRFPVAAVRFLERAGFRGNLVNSWSFGGYLIWALPAAKDLVDGRNLPGHLAVLEHLATLDRPGLHAWLDARDVRGAILSREDGWVQVFAQAPRFTRAFFDDRAVVFLRGDGAAAPAAASYRYIRPESSDPSYLVSIARGPEAAAAEAELRRAAADLPDAFLPRFLLGVFLEAQGRPEALEQYVAAAQLNLGLAIAHHDLDRRAGAFALATRQPALVVPLLRTALQMRKRDPIDETLLGTALYMQKELPEAEALLRRALERAPDFPPALGTLGFLLVDTGRAAEAVPLFDRAARLAPADESAAYGRALALERSGRRADAAPAWRAFLERFPASQWADQARRHLAP